jgi:hypothetical protein
MSGIISPWCLSDAWTIDSIKVISTSKNWCAWHSSWAKQAQHPETTYADGPFRPGLAVISYVACVIAGVWTHRSPEEDALDVDSPSHKTTRTPELHHPAIQFQLSYLSSHEITAETKEDTRLEIFLQTIVCACHLLPKQFLRLGLDPSLDLFIFVPDCLVCSTWAKVHIPCTHTHIYIYITHFFANTSIFSVFPWRHLYLSHIFQSLEAPWSA